MCSSSTFSFAVIVFMANRDVAARDVDHHVERALECRPFLYEVIADQLKMAALREHEGLILQRTVLEVEHETAGDAIAVRGLNEVAVRQETALGRTQREKTVYQPFQCVARRRVLRMQRRSRASRPGPARGRKDFLVSWCVIPLRGKPARRWFRQRRMNSTWLRSARRRGAQIRPRNRDHIPDRHARGASLAEARASRSRARSPRAPVRRPRRADARAWTWSN